MASVTRTTYPVPPTSEQVDDYHGTVIADPYRPVEDSDAPETRRWIEAENALTLSVLEHHPGRDGIRRRLTELWDYPRAGAPWRRGRFWFQLRNTGLQDQDVLWVADAPDAEGEVLFDPNELSAEGTTHLASIAISEDGERAALALSHAGSDWHRWRVRDVRGGEDLTDRIEWSKFSSAAWTHDGAGFFYGRFPEPPVDAAYDAPNLNMEVRYHRLGTDSADDLLIFSAPHEPEWGFEPEVSDDGRTLVVTVWRGTDPKNRVYVADLTASVEDVTVRPFLDAADARYEHIATIDGRMYLFTDKDSPRGRVIAIDLVDPTTLHEIVPEASDALEFVEVVGNRLALAYLHHAQGRLAIAELDGRPVGDVALPAVGSILDLSGRREDEELFVTFASFASPPSPLAVRMADGTVREVRGSALAWDPVDFVTEQVFVTSGDGTQLPLFLTRRRDVEPTGDVSTLLHGYGGFNIPQGPLFKPEWLAWMERGGLLVGATVNQHSDLYGAALAEVGIMDMLRFHKFTIGWGWTSDFGSPDDPEGFRTVFAYSPLHNIRPGAAYPPTLITTGDHDDRVVPGHSFKYAAALQAAQAGDAPIVIRIDTDAGHGLGKPVGKLIDERTDVLAFLELALGVAEN